MKFIRLLSTFLSLVMLLGTFAMLLTACGDTPDESTTTAPPATDDTPSSTTAPPETEAPLPPQTDPISKDGLMLWYDFQDGEACDLSGNEQNGSVYGTTETVPGVWGDALFLSGGYVDLPDVDFTQMQNFSVSLWVCPLRATDNSRAWVFSSSTNTSFALLSPSSETDTYSAMLKISGTAKKVDSPTAFGKNAWKHIVVTFSGDDGRTMTVYEDGVKVQSSKIGSTIRSLGKTTENKLGRAERVAIHDFYGYMDDFKMYSRTLTDDEVVKMAEQGFTDLMQTAAEDFSLAELNGMTKLDAVMQTLTLPEKKTFSPLALDSLTVTSSNTAVLGNDGVFTSPDAATAVELSLEMKRGEWSYTHKIPLTVQPKGAILPDKTEVITCIGNLPTLPEAISANNGSASLAVEWDEPRSDKFATLCATPGSFEVSGQASDGSTVKATVIVREDLFENPLVLPSSPDPYITYHEGYYYYVKTSVGKICIAKARRLQDIGAAPLIPVWSDSTNFSEYWAPELSFVDGCWYVYFAPKSKALNSRRMFVLRSTEPNNAQAPYEMVGQMGPTVYNETTGKWELDPNEDIYALDGTVLDLGEKKYFIYSAHKAKGVTTQQIFINEMADATTLMGSRVKLPAGGTRFEQMCDIGDPICEGPQILRHDGKVFVLYSTDMSNYQWYQICALYADESSDLLDPASWKKLEGPLLTKSLDPADRSLAPGHACTVKSPDGKEDWLVYHAYEGSTTSFSGEQEARCARMLKIEWDENGMPVMGNPIAYDVLQQAPSGSSDGTVALRYEAEYAIKSTGTRVLSDIRAANQRSVLLSASRQSKITLTVNIPEDGRYLISVLGSGIYDKGVSQMISVDGTEYKLKQNMNRLSSNKDAQTVGNMRATPSCLYDSPNGEGLYLDLKAGSHTIVISAGDADSCVDYIYLLCEK